MIISLRFKYRALRDDTLTLLSLLMCSRLRLSNGVQIIINDNPLELAVINPRVISVFLHYRTIFLVLPQDNNRGKVRIQT